MKKPLSQSSKKVSPQQAIIKPKINIILNKAFNPDDYITPRLLRDEVLQIRQAFEIFDKEGNGVINSADLKKEIVDLGFVGQNRFIYDILEDIGEDENIGMDFGQFLRLASARIGEHDSQEQINKVFKAFDRNNQGKFTVQELKTVIEEIGEKYNNQQIQYMFKKADLDDDGFVTMEDFYNIVTHRVYWDQR